MAVRAFKPKTASLRHTVLLDKRDLKAKPSKRLTATLKKNSGRNFQGKITTRHRGGGFRRHYRLIDFKRDKVGIEATVKTIEYDPNRSANIALVQYADGEKRYILAPQGLEIGHKVMAGVKDVPIKVGNTMPLKLIPSGSFVHNIELVPGKGGQIARSAGIGVQIMGGDKGYIQLKMPSGEIRLMRDICMATVGSVGNSDHNNVELGKAGRSRKMGRRPSVRGVAMSYKHPHGGGQGKSGRHGPGGPKKDLWGNRVGTRTRKNKRTNKFIVKRRQTKHRKAKSYKTII